MFIRCRAPLRLGFAGGMPGDYEGAQHEVLGVQ